MFYAIFCIPNISIEEKNRGPSSDDQLIVDRHYIRDIIVHKFCDIKLGIFNTNNKYSKEH